MPSLFASPCVTVEIEQSSIYLHPSPEPSMPGDDQLLRGSVILKLPKARRVSGVRVKLSGHCSYVGGSGWPPEESDAALTKELSLAFGEEVLSAGEHRLDFSFIIPASTADFQRCAYGRIFHHVSAEVDLHSSRIKSPLVPVWFVSNPTPILGGAPEPYTDMLTTFYEDLGPVRVVVSAPHLTVASLILYEFSLTSPPAGLVITALEGFLDQAFTVQYLNASKAEPPPSHQRLFTVDRSTGKTPPIKFKQPSKSPVWDRFDHFPALPRCVELATSDRLEPVIEGKEWTHRKLSRLPHDDKIRPSTLEHTQTPIRVAHKIGASIRFRKDGGEEKVMHLTQKVHLVSCCCLLDSLRLPSYSKDAQKPVKACTDDCVCSSSFRELVEQDEFGFIVREDEQAGWSHLGEDPRTKTPAVGAITG